jgi:hypothetical protein
MVVQLIVLLGFAVCLLWTWCWLMKQTFWMV